MKKGIDVSKWDVGMNYALYDWDFAFVKVSEGSVKDSLFDTHWNGFRGRTQRGGYSFFRAFVDPLIAVQRFVEYLDRDYGELPPVLDLEVTDNIDVKTVVSRALTWLINCERVVGKTPIVYSSPDFITNVLKLHLYPDFARYPLWLAAYPYDKIYEGYTEADRERTLHEVLIGTKKLFIPAKPKPFVRTPYYQWTGKGNPEDVPGYYTGTGSKKAVDFNFELEDLPDPQPGEPMFFKVTADSLNIRSSAAVLSDNDLGADNLLKNDIIEVEDSSVLVSGTTWRKILRWWRNNVQRSLPASPTGERWTAEKSQTSIFMISTIFTPPDPSPVTLTHTVEVYSDGNIKIDGNPYP